MITHIVSDEDNRRWHLKNIADARRWIETVKRENDERLKRAEAELDEAQEWARADGIGVER